MLVATQAHEHFAVLVNKTREHSHDVAITIDHLISSYFTHVRKIPAGLYPMPNVWQGRTTTVFTQVIKQGNDLGGDFNGQRAEPAIKGPKPNLLKCHIHIIVLSRTIHHNNYTHFGSELGKADPLRISRGGQAVESFVSVK
jgi:hypothetical protein